MADEIVLGGKTYISSKRAARESGYAQDYVGQLARGGQIDAQRVGGLWYVDLGSLVGYKQDADQIKREPTVRPVVPQVLQDVDSAIVFEGREYISASRASKLSGYNQDYIGQLARSEKIPSRQIGNRWYVDGEALLLHKKEKDALLATVQSESVGLQIPRPINALSAPHNQRGATNAHFSYFLDDQDLLPQLTKNRESEPSVPVAEIAPIQVTPTTIPIKRTATIERAFSSNVAARVAVPSQRPAKKRSKRIFSKVLAGTGAALTILLMVSYGIGTLKNSSTYATGGRSQVGGVSGSFYAVLDTVEDIVAPEMQYQRE